MKRLNILWGLLIVFGTTCQAIELPSIISDNMVLQQNAKVSLWGWTDPGESIEISTSWEEEISAVSDESGNWICQVQTPQAGGPYELQISGNNETITLKNILIGEVWFCSGQSNMEMPLAGWPPNDPILNSIEEIAKANYPNIRLFTVTRAVTAYPKQDCIGQWDPCIPQVAKSFSATAYFFGRELYNELGVPIGLIHSSWGGTPAESWIPENKLERFEEFRSVLKKINTSKGKIKKREEWLEAKPKIKVKSDSGDKKWSDLDFKDQKVINPAFNDNTWKVMQLPQFWENTEMDFFDGVIWFRKQVMFPSHWMEQDLVLELGPIDDMDITYLNGVKIGENMQEGLWQVSRIYNIPANLVKSADNTLAVRVIDNQGGGGIYGDSTQMKIYLKKDPADFISLAGEWKYLPIAEYQDGQFFLFDLETQEFNDRPKLEIEIGPHTPTCLFNAMVNPIKPYGLKGFIWYQGESNAGNPDQYQYLFPTLINSWRQKWQNEALSFYYTQIAPYDYGEETSSQRLREAQLKALSVPNTGMAVTLDIGNANNIHPANKQDVGKRLALWALAKDYHKEIDFSGPIYRTSEIKANEIILTFDYADDGLILKSGRSTGFLIAGEDKEFKEAGIRIDGNSIIVSNPQIQYPVAVRYAWDNIAVATLFNRADLPASSFRTDTW